VEAARLLPDSNNLPSLIAIFFDLDGALNTADFDP